MIPPLDPTLFLVAVGAGLAALAMVCAAALRGWERWLALRAREIDAGRPQPDTGVAGRIELADLRERVRQLEAIAAGVDL